MPTYADLLRARTKRFAFDIIALVRSLPRGMATDAVARQLIRAATSVAANHRAAARARSRREFISTLAVVLEEADETELWLDALEQCETGVAMEALQREARELRAIFSAALRTARANPRHPER